MCVYWGATTTLRQTPQPCALRWHIGPNDPTTVSNKCPQPSGNATVGRNNAINTK